jgi:hypothetical protein
MGPTPPPTTSSDLSATHEGHAPPRVHELVTPKAWQERQAQRDNKATALLNVMDQMAERLGGILALDQATARGDVLGALSATIPANGVLTRGWKQAAAAVVVANFTPADVLVVSAVPQTSAPGPGTGIFRVPSGVARVLHMRGTAVSVYGLAGGSVDIVALARPREPAAAVVSEGALEGVLVAPGTTTSQTLVLTGSRQGIVVVQNVSAVAGGSLQVTLNALTPSGYSYPVLVGTALTVVGAVPLRVGLALTPSPNAVANDVVPRELQVVATVTGAITYGLDVIGAH